MKTPSELREMLEMFKARKKKLSEINVKDLPLSKKVKLIRIHHTYHIMFLCIEEILGMIEVDLVTDGRISKEEIKECYLTNNRFEYNK